MPAVGGDEAEGSLGGRPEAQPRKRLAQPRRQQLHIDAGPHRHQQPPAAFDEPSQRLGAAPIEAGGAHQHRHGNTRERRAVVDAVRGPHLDAPRGAAVGGFECPSHVDGVVEAGAWRRDDRRPNPRARVEHQPAGVVGRNSVRRHQLGAHGARGRGHPAKDHLARAIGRQGHGLTAETLSIERQLDVHGTRGAGARQSYADALRHPIERRDADVGRQGPDVGDLNRRREPEHPRRPPRSILSPADR